MLVCGSRIAHTYDEYAIGSMMARMLGELVNIPTDTLFDMLFVILGGGIVLTANDVT